MNNKVIVFAPGWSSLPKHHWNPLLRRFKEYGYGVHSIDYPRGGIDSIKRTASEALETVSGLADRFDHQFFVGHSMGGLVGRYLIQKLGYRPDAYVSLGTPHNGSPLAKYTPKIGPLVAAAQMAPGSYFLQSLDRGLWPSEVRAMTLEAQWDLLVPNGRMKSLRRTDFKLGKSTDYNWLKFPNEKIPWTGHATLLTSQRTFWEIYSFLEF